MTIRFIGDVHGKYSDYANLLNDCDQSIQVGDMGIGLSNQTFPTLTTDHRFIRGNHDNPFLCELSPNFIPDGTLNKDMFFIGGAYSHDQHHRTEGVDWWREEELSIAQLSEMVNKAIENAPRVMVTHDCPQSVLTALFGACPAADDPNRTRQALDAIFTEHRPEYWFFGHHHIRADKTILGTRFICLEELGTFDL